MLEETAYDAALARLKHEAEVFRDLEVNTSLSRKSLQVWMWDWYTSTTPYLTTQIDDLISTELSQELKGKPRKATPIGSFLRLVDPGKMVLIAILELLNMLAAGSYTEGVRTTRMVMTIGAAIEAEHHFQRAKKNGEYLPDFKRSSLPGGGRGGIKSFMETHKERMRERVAQKEGGSGEDNLWLQSWTQEVRARVGAVVLDALMEKAQVVQSTVIEGKT